MCTVLLASLNFFCDMHIRIPHLKRLESSAYARQRPTIMDFIFRMREHYNNNSVRHDIFSDQSAHLVTPLNNLNCVYVASFSLLFLSFHFYCLMLTFVIASYLNTLCFFFLFLSCSLRKLVFFVLVSQVCQYLGCKAASERHK